METAIEEFEEQMNNCINTQQLIMKEFNKNEESKLNKFYQVIKQNKQIK
jgi:methyltransferase-like protein